jgi:hypothetical protein
MAPMTPPTAVEMPEPPEESEESEEELGVALELEDAPLPLEEDVELAQTPVVFPQAVHHVTGSPMAIFDISALKLLHGRVVSDWPKRGYVVRPPLVTAEPLENMKRTEISSRVG